MLEYAFFCLAVTAYVGATVVFYLAVVHPRHNRAEWVRGARRILTLAAALQLGDISVRSAVTHTCPVSSAQFGLSLAAWVAVVVFLAWARTEKQSSVGVMIAPIGLALQVASVALGYNQIHTRVPSWYLAAHVTSSLIGVGFFVLAAAAASVYLFQSTRLKAKRASLRSFAFPGLSSLESLGHHCLGLGLGAMTLGVVSGAVFAERLAQSPGGTLRAGLSYASWLIAAIVVLGQRVTGWHGRRVALWTIVTAALAVGVVLLYALPGGGRP